MSWNFGYDKDKNKKKEINAIESHKKSAWEHPKRFFQFL